MEGPGLTRFGLPVLVLILMVQWHKGMNVENYIMFQLRELQRLGTVHSSLVLLRLLPQVQYE